jgi:hypothetical protein
VNAMNSDSEQICSKGDTKVQRSTLLNSLPSSDLFCLAKMKPFMICLSCRSGSIKSGVITAFSAIFVELFVNQANVVLNSIAQRLSFE